MSIEQRGKTRKTSAELRAQVIQQQNAASSVSLGYAIDECAAIDELILAERIILALQAIRGELGCGLNESLDEFQRRYDRLRAERPDDFMLPPEKYGRNFYS